MPQPSEIAFRCPASGENAFSSLAGLVFSGGLQGRAPADVSTERFRTRSAVSLGILTAVSIDLPMRGGGSLLIGRLVEDGGEVEVSKVGRDSADLDDLQGR